MKRASIEFQGKETALVLRIETVESVTVDKPSTSTVSALEQELFRVHIKQEPEDLPQMYEL